MGHLGRLVLPRTEVFAEVRLVPNTLSWDWHAGAEVELAPAVSIGGSYAVVAQETRVWTALHFGLDTGARATWSVSSRSFEGALTYRFNEFFSGELVATSQGEWWLRLISNL